ncbi:MAG TPA: ABC transporter ATP-binding protein [Ilumatobacter sp.]|nr:ABC transporter ATP-binding protein [Ilumatobacter sp.]
MTAVDDAATTSGLAPSGLVDPDRLRSRRAALWRIAPILRRHRSEFAGSLLLNLGSQVGLIGAAVCAAWIVGAVADGGRRGDLMWPIVWMAAAVLVRVGCVWGEMWVAHDLAYRVMADLRVDVFDGLERLAPAWLLGQRTGDVGAAAMSDVETLEWFYAHAAAQFAVTVATPLAAVAILFTVDPALGAVVLPLAVALATVPLWLARRADRQGAVLRTAIADLHADTVDAVQGLRELAAFGATQRFRQRLRQRSSDLARAQSAHGRRAGFEAAVSDLLVAMAMIATVVVSARLVRGGDLSTTMLPIAVLLAATALGPIADVIGGVRNLGALRAAAARVYTVIDTPARVTDRPDPPPAPEHAALDVRFEDVTFRYSPAAPLALDAASFEIPAEQTVALVGASGAGKSTCVNLLLRFWDPDTGTVRVGGHDARDLSQRDLRELVSLVPQDVYLFNTTIADNIGLGSPHATPDAVRHAAEQALVTEFTDDLPDGLDTTVGERGARLSGGQRQRIAIARALLRRSPILVLDEAVSSLDAAGETLVHAALEQARQGRTTLVIAHRLSTIRNADRIVVLDAGRVAETGTHDELLARRGACWRLLGEQLQQL